jgi:hypothetical protein
VSGRALITAGDEQILADRNQIAVVGPDTPHGFTNLGPGRLEIVCIHASPAMVTHLAPRPSPEPLSRPAPKGPMMTTAQRDLRGWAGPAAGLSFIAGVGGAAVRASDPYPRPWATVPEVQRYFTNNRAAARTSVTGQLVSAAALTVFSTTVFHSAAPNRTRARAGRTAGALAAASLALSATCSLLLTTARGRDPDTARRLHRLGFASGGPLHTATFGALVGTLGIDASGPDAPGRVLRTASLVAAATGVLSPLYYLARPFGFLIVASRFIGLGAVAATGVRLATGNRPIHN